MHPVRNHEKIPPRSDFSYFSAFATFEPLREGFWIATGIDLSMADQASFLVLPWTELGQRFLICTAALAVLDFGLCYRTKGAIVCLQVGLLRKTPQFFFCLFLFFLFLLFSSQLDSPLFFSACAVELLHRAHRAARLLSDLARSVFLCADKGPGQPLVRHHGGRLASVALHCIQRTDL